MESTLIWWPIINNSKDEQKHACSDIEKRVIKKNKKAKFKYKEKKKTVYLQISGLPESHIRYNLMGIYISVFNCYNDTILFTHTESKLEISMWIHEGKWYIGSREEIGTEDCWMCTGSEFNKESPIGYSGSWDIYDDDDWVQFNSIKCVESKKRNHVAKDDVFSQWDGKSPIEENHSLVGCKLKLTDRESYQHCIPATVQNIITTCGWKKNMLHVKFPSSGRLRVMSVHYWDGNVLVDHGPVHSPCKLDLRTFNFEKR